MLVWTSIQSYTHTHTHEKIITLKTHEKITLKAIWRRQVLSSHGSICWLSNVIMLSRGLQCTWDTDEAIISQGKDDEKGHFVDCLGLQVRMLADTMLLDYLELTDFVSHC